MKLTIGSRITDVLTKGFVLTVTPQASTTVSVEAKQAGSALTKRNVSMETSFGPYDSDIEYAVNLLSGTAAEVVESQSTFFLVDEQSDETSFPLRKFSAALAKVKTGSANAKILCVGDSTTLGSGSTGATGYGANGVSLAFPQLLCNRLVQAGFACSAQGAFGTGIDGVSTIPIFDPRVNAPASWVPATVSSALGKWAWRNSTANTTFEFTPSIQVDTFVIYYVQNNGQGTFDLSINAEAAESINANNAVDTVIAKTITAALGTNTLKIARTSGSIYILGIRAYDSSVKQIEILVGAASGHRAIDLTATQNTAWNAKNMMRTIIGQSLTIINLGINDATLSTAIGAFEAAYAELVDWALVSGDVLCVVPYPISTVSVGVQTPYFEAIRAIASFKSVGIIDVNALFGTWTEMNALNAYADTTHPSGVGYAIASELAYQRILTQL